MIKHDKPLIKLAADTINIAALNTLSYVIKRAGSTLLSARLTELYIYLVSEHAMIIINTKSVTI